MKESELKDITLEFIRKHDIAVISTVAEGGTPEAAVIEFGETNNLELIFDTFSTSRKYANLQRNKQVAFVIGWDENITVQYEGDVHELSGDEVEKYKQIYFKKNIRAKKWGEKPEIRYFKVVPRWVRYSDLNVNPWKIYEVNFESK